MVYNKEVATNDQFDLEDHSLSSDFNKHNPPGYDESNKQKISFFNRIGHDSMSILSYMYN